MLIDPEKKRVYFGIYIGGIGKKKKYLRNIVFEDQKIARFYYDQEAHALPKSSMPDPDKYRITYVEEWEVDGSNYNSSPMKLFVLPQTISVMLSDYTGYSSMSLIMKLHETELYYSTKFGMIGDPLNEDLDMDKTADMQIFGVRLRPSCYAPNRRNNVSMRGIDLPGLWYFTVGYRFDEDCDLIFAEEINPCMICQHNKS